MKNKKSFILVLLLTLTMCMSLFGCGSTPDTYNIVTKVWYAGFGSSYGTGTYDEQTDVTITASPKQGSEFVGWVKDNVVVSYSKDYTFKINKETAGTYVALFTYPEKNVVTLKNITLNSDYDADSLEFTNLNVEFWIGGSFKDLHLVYKTDVNETTSYDITDIIFALNGKQSIPAKVVLNYTITTIIDDEETSYPLTSETKLEINLDTKTPNLKSEALNLTLPAGIKGTLTTQYTFGFLEPIKAEPDAPQAE